MPGAGVRFGRPEGGFVPRPGPRHHLFVGDETASAAFGPMARALHTQGAEVRAVIETDTPAERLPLHGDITWHCREGASAAPSAGLLAALREARLPEPGDALAYVAGEARTIQSVRRHLVHDRGRPRRAVVTKPFWTRGKRGLD
ncbi:siderophore-interacting protein [Streptomyces sp. NBC_01186]|uniref:siderophore-interacting protein n=1 Tax=Streptomyces sp. NBC_01186 TaxID=2903765 RepID=UPI002E10C559|nr:siderophore-interacting protein [Streptomyces sp. NBC_01186]